MSIIVFNYTFVQIEFWKRFLFLGNSVSTLTGSCNPCNLLFLMADSNTSTERINAVYVLLWDNTRNSNYNEKNPTA